MKILLELRPAFDGHAGIPQETRLLFRGLSKLDGCSVEGLMQSSNRLLSKALPAPGKPLAPGRIGPSIPEHRKLDRLARVVVSLQHNPPKTPLDRIAKSLRLIAAPAQMIAGIALGMYTPLRRFEGCLRRTSNWSLRPTTVSRKCRGRACIRSGSLRRSSAPRCIRSWTPATST
jgi:hypothetical protein